MIKYDRLFKKNLLTEADELEQAKPDSEVWKNSLSDTTDPAVFDVKGAEKEDMEKYSNIIDNWSKQLKEASAVLKQMHEYSGDQRLKSFPGTQEFKVISKRAPKLDSDLNSFISQVESLKVTVKLAIKDEKEKD